MRSLQRTFTETEISPMHPSHRVATCKGKRRRQYLVWLAAFWFCFEGATGGGPLTFLPPPWAPDRDRKPSLKPVTAKRLQAVLKKKQGKVVLLNFWATWCAPCREEFPALIKLYRQYRSRGLELILVSADDREQQEQVESFLKQSRVNFVTYISAEESYEALTDFMAPDWIGGLPTTFVFDRKGQLAKSLLGGQNYEVFRKAVVALL